jgi:hypothetical protein
MKEEHPLIFLILIPENYTTVLQPVDIIIQRPFKHAFKKQFVVWATTTISNQLDMKVQVKLDTRMSHIRPHLHKWLHEAW